MVEIILTDRGLNYLLSLNIKEKAVRIRAIDTFE